MNYNPQILLLLFLISIYNNFAHAKSKSIDTNKTKLPIVSYKSSDLSISLSAGVLGDYTYFDQDSISMAQVGAEDSQFDLRAARFALYGNFKLFDEEFKYLLSCGFSDYLTRDAKTLCNLFNATILYDIPEDRGRISIGKMKEPWSYEMVGDSVALPQSERFLKPFFQSRNIGIQYSNQYLDKHGTYTVGIFNDWLDEDISFADNSQQFTARVTLLPYISDDHMNYIHLAISSRYNIQNSSTLRYKGQPESNVANIFVDTGAMDADSAIESGVEFLWSHDGVSILGEYLQSNVSSRSLDNPKFDGWYILGSWILSGDGRPYDQKLGYAREIIPKTDQGAIELMARYSRLDLDDDMVHGGEMEKWTVGINWWKDAYWKLSMNYGRVNLDRFGMQGRSDIALFRIQWVR